MATPKDHHKKAKTWVITVRLTNFSEMKGGKDSVSQARFKRTFKRRTLHVPNLIRGEKKYHPYCLKQGNKLKKVKFTKPGNSCFDFSVICALLWQGDS